MNKEKLKSRVVYVGIPVLMITLLFACRNRMDAFTILQREVLIVIGYIIMIEDIKNKQIPNKFLSTLFCAWVLIMFPKFIVDIEGTLTILKNSVIGFAIGGGLFLIVYLISKKGLGGGDVKFMAITGLYMGFSGILSIMLYGSVLASLFGIVMILLKKTGRKDTLPLAPFLYIGILLTVFFL